MKTTKTMTTLAISIGMVASMVPVVANAASVDDGAIVKNTVIENSDITTETTEAKEHKVLCEIFMVEGNKPEDVLALIGADGTDYILSEDGTMFTCAITEEQAIKAKFCELVKCFQLNFSGNNDTPEHTVVYPSYPADNDTELIPSYPAESDKELTSYPAESDKELIPSYPAENDTELTPSYPAENDTESVVITAKTYDCEIVKGDANCDGIVNMADAVTIMQYMANPNKYPISEQGRINGDIDENGLTNADAQAIQLMILNVIRNSSETEDSDDKTDLSSSESSVVTKPIKNAESWTARKIFDNGEYSESVVLSAEETGLIKNYCYGCKYETGTADCINDYEFTMENGAKIYYHSDCGTFNDNTNELSYNTTDYMRDEINMILGKKSFWQLCQGVPLKNS